MYRGGKIGPAWWVSPVHPELGTGWAIKLLARPGPPEFFLPLKGYLARPVLFLGRAGLLKFWQEKIRPILARPTVGQAQPGPARPARLPTLFMYHNIACSRATQYKDSSSNFQGMKRKVEQSIKPKCFLGFVIKTLNSQQISLKFKKSIN